MRLTRSRVSDARGNFNEELSQRAATRSDDSPNWQAEAQAMQTLARQMASGSETLLQDVVETTRERCQAGSAGISLLETTPNGAEIFCWIAIAGTLAHQISSISPLNSPCGVCLERATPQLFSYPERYFTYLEAVQTPIVEALVLPLIANDHAISTIWIMSHDQQRQFDSEDVQMMTSLADFAITALHQGDKFYAIRKR